MTTAAQGKSAAPAAQRTLAAFVSVPAGAVARHPATKPAPLVKRSREGAWKPIDRTVSSFVPMWAAEIGMLDRPYRGWE